MKQEIKTNETNREKSLKSNMQTTVLIKGKHITSAFFLKRLAVKR